jgi:sugar (pentulose or hexulose) kinase
MLGSHTDLWAPLQARPSRLAASLDLPRLTPPLRPAWERLGAVTPALAALTELAPSTQVLNGVHDSNASLLPHLASRQAPFTIVSTGTWVILMAVGIGVERLVAADDMLANVDVEGRPIACARFMGGREFHEIVGDARGEADTASVRRVIASGAMALPCFAPQGGPFASRKGEVRGKVAAGDRVALATLYVALMSDLMLTRLGANQGDLIVEGSFAANAAFAQLLAALRPTQRVFRGSDAAGTARGASLLAQWPTGRFPAAPQQAATPMAIGELGAYRAAWTEAIARTA